LEDNQERTNKDYRKKLTNSNSSLEDNQEQPLYICKYEAKDSNSSLEDNQGNTLPLSYQTIWIQIPHWKIIKFCPPLILKGALVDSNSSLEDNQDDRRREKEDH